ncbi:primosomal protein N' [Candidatus Parcubacteria bacterium]|nr:primosomal protein N' [Candidatus Parcubacteria bacterium]
MYILRVAPLTTIPLPHEQVLDYFSTSDLPKGALVEISLNRRTVAGIVLASTLLVHSKAAVRKSARYTLRNVSKVLSAEPVVTPRQLELARWVAKYYWTPFGHAFKAVLTPPAFKKPLAIPSVLVGSNGGAGVPRLVWKADRSGEYRAAVERALDRGMQVLWLVPDQTGESYWREWLERECISHAIYSSALSARAARTVWQRVAGGGAFVVLGTRSAMFLPFQKLGLIIVDDEEANAYKSWDQSPRYDTREVAEKLAELFGAQLVFGSFTPTSTIMLRARRGRLKLEGPDADAGRALTPTIVDLRAERRAGIDSPLSRSLQERVADALAMKRPVLLFINRRGTAPVVLCRDCGTVVGCPRCSATMVQHRGFLRAGVAGNVLVCHHCDTRRQVPETCPHCRSHELRALGAGTERVEAEAKKLWPAARVARLDTDASPTSREVSGTIEKFVSGDTDILVATQLALALRWRTFSKAPLLGIVVLDALLSFPDYRVQERLWQLIRMLGVMSHEVVIQTYLSDQPFLEALKRPPEAFYAAELAERRALRFPPFSELIKLTFRHRDATEAQTEAVKLAARLSSLIEKAKASERVALLGPAPAFIAKERSKYVWNIVVQSRLTSLKARNTILSFVPREWVVDVHPDSIL